jgi:uncharacterized repeat protein (TIGR03803 family)
MPCCKWGYLPNRVIRDLAANLYGTAIGGGAYAEGVIFNLDATGSETVLYSFMGGADGRVPSQMRSATRQASGFRFASLASQ